jgi:hypothetical protein
MTSRQSFHLSLISHLRCQSRKRFRIAEYTGFPLTYGPSVIPGQEIGYATVGESPSLAKYLPSVPTLRLASGQEFVAFVAVTCVGQLASPLQRNATDLQSFPVKWVNFATKNSDTSRTRSSAKRRVLRRNKLAGNRRGRSLCDCSGFSFDRNLI